MKKVLALGLAALIGSAEVGLVAAEEQKIEAADSLDQRVSEIKRKFDVCLDKDTGNYDEGIHMSVDAFLDVYDGLFSEISTDDRVRLMSDNEFTQSLIGVLNLYSKLEGIYYKDDEAKAAESKRQVDYELALIGLWQTKDAKTALGYMNTCASLFLEMNDRFFVKSELNSEGGRFYDAAKRAKSLFLTEWQKEDYRDERTGFNDLVGQVNKKHSNKK